MAPGPPAIQMLWVAGALPWYAEASVNSFLSHGHSVELYAYDPPPNLPLGCAVKDAALILPRDRIFVYRAGHHKGHLSGFSNWFRYALLARNGGWWSDCDVICIAPFTDGGKDYVFASEYKSPNPRSVNPNVMFVRCRSAPIMLECESYCEGKGDDIDHAETGPTLLDRMVRRYNLQAMVTKPEVFNPISFDDTNILLDSKVILLLKKYSRRFRRLRSIDLSLRTRSIHLYASVLTNCGTIMSSAAEIPKASFLAGLIRSHGRPQMPPAARTVTHSSQLGALAASPHAAAL